MMKGVSMGPGVLCHRKEKSAPCGTVLFLLLCICAREGVLVEGFPVPGWAGLATGPSARASAIMGAFYQPPTFQDGSVGKRMLVLFGGDDGTTAMNDLWYYDVATNTWTSQAVSSPPPGSFGRCGCVAGPADSPRLYVFGGRTGTTYENTMYSLDLLTSGAAWVSVTLQGSAPTGREYCAMKALWSASDIDTSATIFLFGGRTGTGFRDYLSDLYAFDVATEVWSSKTPYIASARAMVTFAQISTNQLWAWGGLNFQGSWTDTYYYNATSNSWTVPSTSSTGGLTLRYGTFNSARIQSGNTFYVFGGVQAGGYFNELWSTPIPTSGSYSSGNSGVTSALVGGVTTTVSSAGTPQEVFFVFGGDIGGGSYTNQFRVYGMANNAQCTPTCSGQGTNDPLRACQCYCNAGWGGPSCTVSCPICVNGVANNCTCSCYAGWDGPACDVPVCPSVRCIATSLCAIGSSTCSTPTGNISALYAEPLNEVQVPISTLSDNTFLVSSRFTGQNRITVTIPADSFVVKNSAGDITSENVTLVSIKSVDVAYLSTIPTPVNYILSNVIDITLQPNVVWLNATTILNLTVESSTDSFTPAEVCLAFIDTSVNQWRCVGSALSGTGTTRTGTTTHFTSFGVLVTPSSSSGGGDGGDGFDTVYIAPIVIGVVFALFVVVVVVVVGTVVGYFIRRQRRNRLMGVRDSVSMRMASETAT